MKADFRSVEFAPGKVLSIETGRLAKQAHGSVVARMGDTMVLATAVGASEPKPGQGFFPLSVDFRENYAAAGKFPGGFIKREGRPSEKEILSARLIDRTIRPMFPEGYLNEVQVMVQVISSDGQNDGDVIGGTASSLALLVSDIPFNEPIAEVRVARVDGAFVVNPTVDQMKKADMDMVIGGTAESVAMVEGEMDEVSEAEMIQAIRVGHEAIVKLCAFQTEIQKEFGKEKREVEIVAPDATLVAKIKEIVGDRFLTTSKAGLGKKEYSNAIKEIVNEVQEKLEEAYPEQGGDISEICHDLQKDALRTLILRDKYRIDGRAPGDIRAIWTEVGYLPRTHGSAIFTRGETQALVTVTLGTKRDEQSVDTLFDTESKRFMLNYNFPPYCTGEVKMKFSVSRREIGHGNLAERALKRMVPGAEEFAYTIRIVSDILESNGSSSMASVCGGSMAMMDAGVPVKKPVAGIAMGMVVGEDGSTVVLSDIQGEEDHFGDMDFKVTGTVDGITACQMDIKVRGVSFEVMEEAMLDARKGRLHILEKMAESISMPRAELSRFAPSFRRIEIGSDQIGAVIGPGGKVIQGIQKETGTEINIEEQGNKGIVIVSAVDADAAEAAIARIKAITGSLEEGEIYEGTVRSIKEYGAFVELVPGKEGLLHISEIDHRRIARVEDVLQEGDKVSVKLLKIENGGKLRLSRKALIPNE
ncbi:MAG: polyribonucleotide nucleotidyltransferase Pnp [Bacteroidetes bacterium HLUCCA01]|nr:MAG: polyribonucleotide nucleotidyltransferase Pnp [Bacteroidetes bacterium HLUCCA01]